MLSGPHDRNSCFISINPGAGGTESQDWAEMLLRMYLRYCEKKGWKTTITEYQSGDEAGIKSATFSVSGEYAYGCLKAEAGIHRLVRISPFDSNARRHTSFASVFVFPEIADDVAVKINESDLRAKRDEREMGEREARAAEIGGEKKESGWGSQIRSYVLHPYKMVKDLRTGVETGNPDAVLDGDLEEFVVAYLMGVRRNVGDVE